MSTRGPRVPLSGDERAKIVRLLRETDLTMTAIAQRFHRSKNVVITVNRKHRIRISGRAVGSADGKLENRAAAPPSNE